MLIERSRRSCRGGREGLTLVELLIVIVLLGIVAGGMMGIVVRQQRFYTGTSGIMETRSSVRQGINVLQRELRGLSPATDDIYAIWPDSIEFRASAGSSVVCTIDGARTTITVPPLAVAAQNGLTSWITAPVLYDSVLVYNIDTRSWQRTRLTAAPTSGATCPMSTGLTTIAGEETKGWTLHLDKALEAGVKPGSSIRFVRKAHYGLYQASDGDWYLGYFECVDSATPKCGTIQPVSGPYVPPGSAGGSGLRFAYFDDAGASTTDRKRVARIDIVMRAQSRISIQSAGYKRGIYQDSLAISIAVRN